MEPTNITEKIVEQDSDYQFIAQANEEFNNRNYEKCLEMLEKIELTSGISSELLHNRAVAKFYKSECKDYSNLLKELNELDGSELADSPKSGSLGMTTSALNPITRYNKAVIYFHRHMHRSAIDTLQPLVDKLDTLVEHIASLVGTLMLTLLLVTNQLNKALAFLDVLQIQIGLSTDNALTVDGSAAESLSSVAFNRNFKLLSMLTNVLNRKVVVIPDDGTPELSALKAHQYYIMKDFQMASKQLKKISAEHYMESALTNELNTCIANNMGVIHLRVRHYAIAATFFQNAITFDKKIAANLRNAPLQNMSTARSCEILYNLGIAMLHLRRPKEAFQALLVPLKTYHSNPRLWFRMAEACIMDHEIKSLEENKKPVFTPANGGALRNSPMRQNTPGMGIMYSPNNQSAAMPEPTLEFAALSLRNALTLTKYYRKTFYIPPSDGNESETQAWYKVKDNNFCNPSNPISKEALDNMLSAIYAAYSYVSLRLGDYVSALEMAQELLKAETLSDAHRLLAHMYAGEALILMHKVVEARPHLDPTLVGTLDAFDFETRDWPVKSLEAAQNIVHYNLAVAMALQGDFKTSLNRLASCTHPIVATKKLALKMYLTKKCT